MGNKFAAGASLGLAVLLIAWGLMGAHEPESARGQDVESPGPGPAETPTRIADGLVEPLLKSPIIRPHGTFQFRLFLMDLAKGKATLIVDEPGQGHTYCGSPWWSNDGKRILFDATPQTMWALSHLFAIELNDDPPKVTDLGMGNCPSLSPDGKRIAFLSNEDGPDSGIHVMNADGSQRARLGSYGRPRFSPDGRQILISSFSNPCQVSLMDVETSATRPLQLPGQQIFSVPTWAEAGTIVAVIGTDAPESIALLDITGADGMKVKSVLWKKENGPDVTPVYPVYHASTRRCVFVGREAKGMALYTVTGGDSAPPKRLEPKGFDHYMGDLAFSPDGRFVIFQTDQGDRQPR